MTKSHPHLQKSADPGPSGQFASAADALQAKIKASATRNFAVQQSGKRRYALQRQEAEPQELGQQGFGTAGVTNTRATVAFKGPRPIQPSRHRSWRAHA